MKGKKLVILVIGLISFAIFSMFSSLIYMNKCKGQVDFKKRGNIISVLNPISNFFCNKAVLQDSKGNLYVSYLGGDAHPIQKFTSEGKYICSYRTPSIQHRIYLIDAEDNLYIFSGEEVFQYKDDKLVSKTELNAEEAEKFYKEWGEQDSEGSFVFWTVKMDNGDKISLQKILSFNMDYSSFFVLLIPTIALLIVSSDGFWKLAESINGYSGSYIEKGNKKSHWL